MSRTKYALVSLGLAALVYFNLAGIVYTSEVRLPNLEPRSRMAAAPLPNHWATENLFRMFSLFAHATWWNLGYSAYGSRHRLDTPPAAPTDDLVDLDVYQYFPQVYGEQNRRLYLRSYRGDPTRLRIEYERMANVLQRLHNEQHPDRAVEQVFIYELTWRRGKEGHFQHFASRKTLLVGHN